MEKNPHLTGCTRPRPSIPRSCPCRSVHTPCSSLFPGYPPLYISGCALPPSNFLVSLHSSHPPPHPLSHSLFFLSHPPTQQSSPAISVPFRSLWENNSLRQAEGERFGDQGHVIGGGGGEHPGGRGGRWGTAGYLSKLHASGGS